LPSQHLPETLKGNRGSDQDPGACSHPHPVSLTEHAPDDRRVKGSIKLLKSAQKTRPKVRAPPVTNFTELIHGNSWRQSWVDGTGKYGGKNCSSDVLWPLSRAVNRVHSKTQHLHCSHQQSTNPSSPLWSKPTLDTTSSWWKAANEFKILHNVTTRFACLYRSVNAIRRV